VVFSSPFFIFCFLPIVLLTIVVVGKRLHNIVLLLASLFFYAWGNVSHCIIFVGSILLNYSFGLLIHNTKNGNAKIVLAIGISINLILLGYFKYFNFFIENINHIFFTESNYMSNAKIALPIGISFFTFHALSYIIDVYRSKVQVQRNIVDMALYISFFPQLIAGPIVRYIDVASQLKQRTITILKISDGAQRFIFGFAKKVIIANALAYVADKIWNIPPLQITTGLSWLGIVCYTYQIYFDFSGYSDMALGLAKIFGFNFPENFNYPYSAHSIKDFWRKWHISLSTWFRDFLYIPLGGNRGTKFRTLFNLLFVFFCTGFWHGASYNFIIWGLFHGTFLLIEKAGFEKLLLQLYKPVQIAYTLFVVMIGWVFFRADNLSIAFEYLKRMFFIPSPTSLPILSASEFIDAKIIVVLIFAVLYSFKIFKNSLLHLENVYSKLSYQNYYQLFFQTSKVVFSISLFLLSICYLSASTYNPFIYFRF